MATLINILYQIEHLFPKKTLFLETEFEAGSHPNTKLIGIEYNQNQRTTKYRQKRKQRNMIFIFEITRHQRTATQVWRRCSSTSPFAHL